MEILLVEDEPDDVRTVQDALRNGGIEANLTVVSKGKDALAAATRKGARPSVILVDLHLPGSSGADLIGQLRALRVNAPCIIVTGMADDAGLVKRAMLSMGAVELLSKPFPPEKLVEAIRSAIK